jgi:hypothetical protein
MLHVMDQNVLDQRYLSGMVKGPPPELRISTHGKGFIEINTLFDQATAPVCPAA